MKKSKLNIFIRILFPFFFIFGIIFIVIGVNDYTIKKVSYNENNDIKYKVYLKKNNFFDTDYIEENRTYISSLIDYIDVNFQYNIKYNVPISGNYNYKIIALVSANKTNSSDYYWQKKFDLTDTKKGEINNSNQLYLEENIKINYDKYNEILNEFRRQYSVSSDNELKIAMEITNEVTSEITTDPIVISSNINMTIPLTEQTVEATINKNATNSSDVFEVKEKSKEIKFVIYKVMGIILLIVSIIFSALIFLSTFIYNKLNKNEVELKKILKNYDSIIATTTSKPVFTGLKKITVNSFNELLDVYNEVRMPINYYCDEVNKENIFMIYNDSFVWVYLFKK